MSRQPRGVSLYDSTLVQVAPSVRWELVRDQKTFGGTRLRTLGATSISPSGGFCQDRPSADVAMQKAKAIGQAYHAM